MNQTSLKEQLLQELYAQYPTCESFPIKQTGATRVVYGYGAADASIMLIGEAPGKDEDLQGKPFVGRSGQLLTKALLAAKLKRQELFITNVVKCRPPNNRTPTPEEIENYANLLLIKEIKIVQPKVILLLGSVALAAVLKKSGISKLRGTQQQFGESIAIPTFHPAYILRNPDAFSLLCEDIKLAKSIL